MGLRRVLVAASVALASALVALGVVVATGHHAAHLHARASAAAPTPRRPRGTSPTSTTPSSARPAATTTTATSTPAPGAAGPSGRPPPSGFEPASVSFVSPNLGYALGEAPCGAPPCTVLLRTRDGGGTWREIPAPAVPIGRGPGDPGTVSQVRFADPLDGFAFDPLLEATFDGGATWHALSLPGEPPGARVVGVGAGGGTAFVLVLPPQAPVTGPPAAGGTARLYRGVVGSPAFSPVPGGSVPDPESGAITVAGTTAFVVVTTASGRSVGLVAGPSGPASPLALPCGQPYAAPVLAPSSPSDLFAICGGGAALGQQPKTAYRSLDGGRTFSLQGPVGADGDLEAAASDGPDTALVAAASVGSYLYLTDDGGRSFREVYAAPTGGAPLSDLAFVSPAEAVAIEGLPEVVSGSVLLISHDGGLHWTTASFGG